MDNRNTQNNHSAKKTIKCNQHFANKNSTKTTNTTPTSSSSSTDYPLSQKPQRKFRKQTTGTKI